MITKKQHANRVELRRRVEAYHSYDQNNVNHCALGVWGRYTDERIIAHEVFGLSGTLFEGEVQSLFDYSPNSGNGTAGKGPKDKAEFLARLDALIARDAP